MHTGRSIAHFVARRDAGSARRPDPVILIQDYHLALLPRLIRQRKPAATITLFWHIPWPSAETFGVCPWKDEIVRHLLDADVVGFHTRQYCLNFLATAEQLLECRVDYERMTVTAEGHVCRVNAYPISIEWPPPQLEGLPSIAVSRGRIRRRYGIAPGVHLGVGVERWDFTKGILERFHALEALLRGDPDLRGRVALLQVAAPSRAKLPAYQALQRETAGGDGADQRQIRRLLLEADRARGPAAVRRTGVRALPGRGFLSGQQPARRDESRLQGVRRRA